MYAVAPPLFCTLLRPCNVNLPANVYTNFSFYCRAEIEEANIDDVEKVKDVNELQENSKNEILNNLEKLQRWTFA